MTGGVAIIAQRPTAPPSLKVLRAEEFDLPNPGAYDYVLVGTI